MSFVRKVVDHLPFLTTAGYFRIAASVLFITYLGTFGFIPIGVFWISLLFIGYKKFRLDLNPLCTYSWHVFTNPQFCICYCCFFEREKCLFNKNNCYMVILQSILILKWKSYYNKQRNSGNNSSFVYSGFVKTWWNG